MDTRYSSHKTRKVIRLLALAALSVTLLCSCGIHAYRLRRAKQLYYQGQILEDQGKTEDAYKKFQASLSLARKENYRPGIAHNLNELAIIKTSKGEYESARRLLREALEIYKELDMKPQVSKVLNNIAITYLRQGDIKNTLLTYQKLLKWDHSIGNKMGQMVVLYNTAQIYEEYLNQPCNAKMQYEKALALAISLKRWKLARTIKRKIKESLNCKQKKRFA